MSDTFEVITSESHRQKGWKPVSSYEFAARSTAAQLTASEIPMAAQAMPLAFVAHEQKVSAVAVLGIVPGHNLFVAPNGKWVGPYIPAVFRSYPFKLVTTPESKFALCIDRSSGLLVDSEHGEPFFTAEGTPTERVRQLMDFLVQTTQGQDAVNRAANLLSQHGLLEAWPIKVRDAEQEREAIGLMRINEAALNSLDDRAFLVLRQGGALALAYAQLLSMSNIHHLGKLAQVHAELKQQTQKDDVARYFNAEDASLDEKIDWDALFKD